jgi:2-polyprenyl-3-methyl-5-hydroxy-6-metoxy-1,4-benzoquinol methylase
MSNLFNKIGNKCRSPHEDYLANEDNKFNWGATSEYYALFRPAPPPSFFEKLKVLGIGTPNQRILDLGTGVGHLAIPLAEQNCEVVGVDISNEQIETAKRLVSQKKLFVRFETIAAEEIQFPKHYFDAVTAMQSWLYFKKNLLYPKLQHVLKPNGNILIGNFDHLPEQDIVAYETEQLMAKYHPNFQGLNFDGYIPPLPRSLEKDFRLKGMFYYDELIPFTHESWRGRIIASKPIGVSLPKEKIMEFDRELQALLNNLVENKFAVLHRLSAHILVFK